MSNLEQNLPKEWKDLATSILEAGFQLHYKTQWREEARAIEPQNSARGIKISQGQPFCEGEYTDLQRQLRLDDHNWVDHMWQSSNQETGLSPLLKLYNVQRILY